MFLKRRMKPFTETYSDKLEQLREELNRADAIIIGAGAGLSTSAGFVYNGKRFETYFSDFYQKYHFTDMYSGGFYPYDSLEEHWAYWSRYIYINRYMNAPKPVYDDLLQIVKNTDYFVLTTNVDHCFQKAGFDKHRLFYTQGDYGLLQCSEPCHQETYDNAELIRRMVLAQGFQIAKDGTLLQLDDRKQKRTIPSEMIPVCPKCGKPMSMNLRADNTFVQDSGWDMAALRYDDFTRRHRNGRTVYLEIGVGFNTPAIIKYNFWQQTSRNPDAVYICLNKTDAAAPREIEGRSICIDGDSAAIISVLAGKKK